MTLPLETVAVKDEYARRALDNIAQQFPIAGRAEVGFLGMWAGGATPPQGWKICDGSAVSRTAYKGLFNIIGTTYGVGDGSTTFNLPDLRDRVPVGVSGTHARGATWGQQAPTMPAGTTGNQSADHTHLMHNNLVGNVGGGGGDLGGPGAYNQNTGLSSGGASNNHTHSLSGVGSATDGNYPPSLGIYYIIKV